MQFIREVQTTPGQFLVTCVILYVFRVEQRLWTRWPLQIIRLSKLFKSTLTQWNICPRLRNAPLCRDAFTLNLNTMREDSSISDTKKAGRDAQLTGIFMASYAHKDSSPLDGVRLSDVFIVLWVMIPVLHAATVDSLFRSTTLVSGLIAMLEGTKVIVFCTCEDIMMQRKRYSVCPLFLHRTFKM